MIVWSQPRQCSGSAVVTSSRPLATHASCFYTNNPRKKCPQILNSFYRMLGFLWDVRCYKSWGMQEQNRGIGFLLTAAARGRGVTIAGASLSEYQHTSTHHTLQTHLKTHDTLPDTSHTTTNMTHHKTHLIPALPLSPVTTSGLDYSGHQLGTETPSRRLETSSP